MKLTSTLERPRFQSIRTYVENVKARRYEILLAVVFSVCSFFLAQAVLFDAAIPFFLPMWAFTRMRFKNQVVFVLIGGLLGSAFLGLGQLLLHLIQLLLFNAISRFQIAQKSLPITVASCILVVQVVWQFAMHVGSIPIETVFFISFEVLLALFMTAFLLYAVPSPEHLFWGEWSIERLGAACIIGVIVLTGMKGLTIGSIELVTLGLHLLLLLAAYVGGLSIATIAGMTVAMILGVSELSFTGMMALYGMTGFMAGALKRFGKLGIAIGALFISCFFFLYDLTLPLDFVYFSSIAAATILFLCIPKKHLTPLKELFEPNQEVENKRQKWMENRLQEQLQNFQQFTDFLTVMVKGKEEVSVSGERLEPTVCQSCFKYEKCWAGEDRFIEGAINEWETAFNLKKQHEQLLIEEKMRYKCVRAKGLFDELEERAIEGMLNGQIQHGRKILALQLRDMSAHLDRVMNDIQGELATYQSSEKELAEQFLAQGIDYFQIDVLSEEPGRKKIVCCIPERKADFETDRTVTERLIIPIIEKYYQEPFKVVKTSVHQEPFSHLQVVVESEVRFELDYGVFATASTSSFYSGDAYEVFHLHEGLVAILLSDGMGQDRKAYEESRKVIQLMRECLHQKMSPETAMHTLYYMMSLKGLEEMYATLDLALVDLQRGILWSWKAGSMSTYIGRGQQFFSIDSRAMPVGILPSSTIEAKDQQLKAGDIVVMLTDGVFQSTISLELQEQAMYNIIRENATKSCDEIAERIVSFMEQQFNVALDDRTVLVFKLNHAIPSWASYQPVSI